jgi:hypothetical protein
MANLIYRVFQNGVGWLEVNSPGFAGNINGDFISAIAVREETGLFNINYRVYIENVGWLSGSNNTAAGNENGPRIDKVALTAETQAYQLLYGVFSPEIGWVFNRKPWFFSTDEQAGNNGKWIKSLVIQLLPR